MRRLRVVGLGDDDETVVLEDPIRHERFAVPGDERLRAAARGDVRRLGQMEIDSTTPLRPRDIQARIRGGESVEQVAAHGGVTHAHVERFAYPVLLERARVAELAGRARPKVEDADPDDTRTLRELVTGTLATRGQDHDEPRWDAWKGEAGEWVVGLAWRAGRTDNLAHWTYRPGPSGGVITARDDPARELLGQAPTGGPRRVGEAPAETAPGAGAGQAEEAEEAEQAGGAADGELEEALPGAATATGEVAPRPGASRGPAARTETRRGGRAEREVPDQRAATSRARTGERRRSTSGSAERRTAAPRGSTGGSGPSSGDTASGDDGADGRGRARRHPIVPSWEDVLLGVRSPRE